MAEPIAISFLTAVVLADALAAKYPGGLAGFDREYPGARHSSHLRAIVFQSSGELEEYLDRMCHFDLAVGRDIGVGEAMHGEWVACPGIRFENGGAGFPGRWIAIHDPS